MKKFNDLGSKRKELDPKLKNKNLALLIFLVVMVFVFYGLGMVRTKGF